MISMTIKLLTQTKNIDDALDNMLSPYDVQQMQDSCPNCKVFLNYFCDGILSSDHAGARKVVYQSKRVLLQNEILYHLDLPRQRKKSAGEPVSLQLMVPQSLRELILFSYHENFCRITSDKIYSSMRQKYYWSMMYADVHNWTKTCIECQTGKPGVAHKAPLKPMTPPALVFEVWHIDHMSLPRSKGYKYALVLVDFKSLFFDTSSCKNR